jgi:hypothetical protein
VLTGIKPGSRLRSPVCDVEVIVIKAPGSDLDLRCGGKPMIQMDEERSTGQAPEPGFDQGTLIGKRYVDETGDLEVLCTKGGPSSLSLGETVLQVKEAKPLPSSD